MKAKTLWNLARVLGLVACVTACESSDSGNAAPAGVSYTVRYATEVDPDTYEPITEVDPTNLQIPPGGQMMYVVIDFDNLEDKTYHFKAIVNDGNEEELFTTETDFNPTTGAGERVIAQGNRIVLQFWLQAIWVGPLNIQIFLDSALLEILAIFFFVVMASVI